MFCKRHFKLALISFRSLPKTRRLRENVLIVYVVTLMFLGTCQVSQLALQWLIEFLSLCEKCGGCKGRGSTVADSVTFSLNPIVGTYLLSILWTPYRTPSGGWSLPDVVNFVVWFAHSYCLDWPLQCIQFASVDLLNSHSSLFRN